MHDQYSNKFLLEILGSFDFAGNTKIHTQKQELIDVTFIHEESHQKLVSSTTFGEMQLILGMTLQKNQIFIKNQAELLTKTVNKSIITQEGYAVWRQCYYSKIYSLNPKQIELPFLYKKAFILFKRVTDRFQNHLEHFTSYISRAIAEACLNTNILNVIQLPNIDLLNDYLEEEINCPDHRLELVTDLLFEPKIVKHIQNRLINTFKSTLEEAGYQKDKYEYVLYQMKLKPYEYITLIEYWDKIVTQLLYDELVKLDLPFQILNPLEVQQHIIKFHNKALSFLKELNIDLFERKQGESIIETLRHQNKISFLSIPKVNETIFRINESLDTVERLLALENVSFVIEFQKFLNIHSKETITTEYIYTTYLTPFEFIENDRTNYDKQNHLKYKLLGDKLTFYGEFTELLECVKNIKKRALILCIEFGTILRNSWNIPDEFRIVIDEINLKCLCVCPYTTAEEFFGIIEIIEKIGINYGSAFARTEYLVYFYFELKNNLNLILKCPIYYLNVAATHKTDEFKKIANYISGPRFNKINQKENENRINEAVFAYQIDTIGVFSHYSE